MSISLTHRLELIEATCACGSTTACVVAEVRHDSSCDKTKPVCLSCLEQHGPAEETLLLEPPTYGSGARAPTAAMRRTANRRETKLAASIGGRKQPASGALPHAKGDVRKIGEWLGDDKTCRTQSFALSRTLLSKVRSWCKKNEKFFISIGFMNKITRQVEDEVVVIDRHVWEKLINARDNR